MPTEKNHGLFYTFIDDTTTLMEKNGKRNTHRHLPSQKMEMPSMFVTVRLSEEAKIVSINVIGSPMNNFIGVHPVFRWCVFLGAKKARQK